MLFFQCRLDYNINFHRVDWLLNSFSNVMLPSNLRRFWVCKYTAKCFVDIVHPCGFLRVNFLFKSVFFPNSDERGTKFRKLFHFNCWANIETKLMMMTRLSRQVISSSPFDCLSSTKKWVVESFKNIHMHACGRDPWIVALKFQL